MNHLDIKELASIVELRCHSPAINLSVFPNDSGAHVWSGSPIADLSSSAWRVLFSNGYRGSHSRDSSLPVRLVRGGQ